MTTLNTSKELTILMPCLNEAETLEICIKKAKKALLQNKIDGEVLIADNGSTDGSQEIALKNDARVVNVKDKGYGNALKGGIEAAYGKYIIMGDADDSYDFENILPFVEKLREGFDLVMGNRFKGGIKKGAMPFLHRYLGNPVLSFIGKLFFNIKVNDFHCGLRGFTKEAAIKLQLKTTGMEFASELVVKAALHKMKITEVPTTLSPDGRSKPPHLRTWRDGWRHLRFLLLYSPKWLFFYPGIFLMLFGLILSVRLIIGPVIINKTIFDIHTLLYTSSLIIIGFQGIAFYLFSKVYTSITGLNPEQKNLTKLFNLLSLERGVVLGIILILLGVVFTILAFNDWRNQFFGDLNPQYVFRIVIPACTLFILGFQVIIYSFFISILQLSHKTNT